MMTNAEATPGRSHQPKLQPLGHWHKSKQLPQLPVAMTETPDIQRAWTVVRRGKPANALQLKTDWPVPKKLEKGEVLVRIQAGALNPLYAFARVMRSH